MVPLRQMKTESMLMPGLIIASCFFTSVEGASEDCIAGAVARQLLLPGQPQDTPFLTCSLLLSCQHPQRPSILQFFLQDPGRDLLFLVVAISLQFLPPLSVLLHAPLAIGAASHTANSQHLWTIRLSQSSPLETVGAHGQVCVQM